MYNQKDLDISSFLTDDPNFQNIIQGFYGLNYLEFIVLSSLYQLGSADTNEIIQQTENGWARNKVNGALKKLFDQKLANRSRVSTEKGGYTFIYQPKPVDEIKLEIIQSVEEWMILAKLELEDLSNHFMTVDTKAYQRYKSKRDEIRKEWFDN